MFQTDNLTTYELERRMDSLPESLSSALTSSDIDGIVESVCRDNHLTDPNKIKSVKQLVSLVVMGFIHAYDLATEINSGLELENPKLSADLASALDAKIFSPIRAELDANYNPNIEENEIDKLVDFFDYLGIKTPLSGEVEKEPRKISAVDSVVSLQNGPKALSAIPAAASSPVPPAPTPAPKGSASLPITPPASAPPKVNPFSAFGGSPAPSLAPKEPSKPGLPTPPTSKPAPFVMHAENKEPQIVQAPKFKFESSGAPISAFGSTGRTPTTPQAPKPAQVEIGREEKLKPTEKTSKFESAPKAIHYSSLSSPITIEGEPTSTSSPKSTSFGNISPMPASPVGKPAASTNEPATLTASSLPVPVKPESPQVPVAPKPFLSTEVPVKNPLSPTPIAPGSFGGLMKDMISPEKKNSSGPNPPLPPLVR